MVNIEKKAFVIGWPITQSLSPTLHNYWIKEAGISASYEKIAVSPEELSTFLNELVNSEYEGGNITIPHKEVAACLINSKTKIAGELVAVNTIWKCNGKIFADNTDGNGFIGNMDDFQPLWREGKTAIVLGAGGAAKAIVYSLKKIGYRKIYIVNRSKKRAVDFITSMGTNCFYEAFDNLPKIISSADLLVNTTSLGMTGQPPLNIQLSGMSKHAIVADIVYNPLETELLKQATLNNLATVDGIGMLLHQAVDGFEKWFGIRPTVTSNLREHVVKELTMAIS